MTWVTVEEFPNYVVNEQGVIMNVDTEHIRSTSRTRTGAEKVTLFKDGVGLTRSVALIVAKAHLYNDHDPEIFDTPIHLDNDMQNNHVDNLAWRPRWFAIKYQKQYWQENYRNSSILIEEENTGERYRSLMEVCQKYGLLWPDVIKSCTQGTTVFPTWKVFSYV